MDVAQMGYRAGKKSRKWHFPDATSYLQIDTLEASFIRMLRRVLKRFKAYQSKRKRPPRRNEAIERLC